MSAGGAVRGVAAAAAAAATVPKALRTPRVHSQLRRPTMCPNRTCSRLTVRADSRGSTERSRRRPPTALSPPPLQAPPPPPPPPPSPPTGFDGAGGPLISKRVLLASVLGGFALGTTRFIYNRATGVSGIPVSEKPFVLPVDENGIKYLTTRGGNKVAVGEDAMGRIWMVDQAGDVFMDTGDPDVGVFAIDKQGNMINYWEDQGKTVSKAVGNINDLEVVQTKEFGEALVFPTRSNKKTLIPADAYMKQNGLTRESFPPFLEERNLTPEELKAARTPSTSSDIERAVQR